MRIKRTIKNDDAFSSTLDSLFFLAFVSISAVILLPALVAEDQYTSMTYISGQEMDDYLLTSLLSSKTDEFDYTFKPGEIVGYNISLPEDTMIENMEEALYTREQNHRSFADIVAESLVLGLEMRDNETHVELNPMTGQHRDKTKECLKEYLDREIGGRYNYRFEAHWYPVRDYIGCDIIIGDIAPEDAIRQNAKISLPVEPVNPRNEVFASMNDTVFQQALNSNDPGRELYNGFFNSIDIASGSAAETVTEVIFPADYLRTMDNTDIISQNEHLSLLTSPDKIINDPELLVALNAIDYTANEVYGLNISVPKPDETLSTDFVDATETMIFNHIRQDIASYVEYEMSDEINRSIDLILNETENSNRLEIRNSQLESICSAFDTDGADITLSLWH